MLLCRIVLQLKYPSCNFLFIITDLSIKAYVFYSTMNSTKVGVFLEFLTIVSPLFSDCVANSRHLINIY